MRISLVVARIMRISLSLATLAASIMISSVAGNSWERPGCHIVGHMRTVSVPSCVSFNVSTNACRGYCVSYAHPSPYSTLQKNSDHFITSKAECCGIADTHDVVVSVPCWSSNGPYMRTFVFKSAQNCLCSICRSNTAVP